jgi:hypothetical protein
MKRSHRLFILAFMAFLPRWVWAWGPVGHETVAYIAQDHLTPQAAQAVADLLGPGQDMASVSNWADAIIWGRPNTADWHHIDLDVRQNLTLADVADYCPKGNCVVGQIEWDTAVLQNPRDSRKAKREALKFLIHFIGDVHQPLHCANDSDRGGNEKFLKLKSFGYHRAHWIKLHSYWDHLLEEKTTENPRELATILESQINPEDQADWEKGEAVDWAFESYLIAKNDIYSELPPGPLRQGWDVPYLPDDYVSGKMRAIVDQQLEKAGIRLAFVLNQIFH